MREKKKLKNRRLVISTLIIIALLSLSTVIIYQYNQYYQVEKRLNAAYSSTNFQSSALYKLFSTFSEADYLFRMYAINFNNDDYNAYTQKLDTLKIVIDSLASLPINNNLIKNNLLKDNLLATEYISLKKQVDNLVYYAKDSIADIINNTSSSPGVGINHPKIVQPNHLVKNILNDTTTLLKSRNDTIVKKRESLFKRVFNAKGDTLVNNNSLEIHNSNRLDIIIQNKIDQITHANKKIYTNNLQELKNTYDRLKIKERELLFANFSLLNDLKNGIERLRSLEFDHYKKNQEADLLIYTKNTKTIKNQLILALSLMLLMVILIIGYQRQVFFYERKLIKEKDYADKVAEEKTSVLANVSHEIRTPLNSLKGLVNILKNNSGDNTIDKEIIDSVDHDITVINSTINDILSLSKLESDSSQIKNENLDIYHIIEDLIGLHIYQAGNKGLELKNDNQLPDTLLINSNSFRIKQVVSNLITNAIKYTDSGSILITSKLRNNTTLIVSVEDTGIGISNEQSDQIFRKYYVADNKSKVGGFGLGLYISKILAEQIGAKLYFKSTIGKGTTFTFELPFKEVKETVIKKPLAHTIKEVSADLKIVFIDDSKINLFFIQQLFKEQETIHFFVNAKEGLDFILSNPVDIVITDLKMPKISGWEILNTIKSDPSLKHIKVFVTTAEPLLLEYNKGKYHFDAMIHKPIKENELVSTILNYKSIG